MSFDHKAIDDIVSTTLMNHPKNCRFKPGAFSRVTSKIKTAIWENPRDRQRAFIDTCEAALREEEIFCPHENINRRAELQIEGIAPDAVVAERYAAA